MTIKTPQLTIEFAEWILSEFSNLFLEEGKDFSFKIAKGDDIPWEITAISDDAKLVISKYL